MKFTDTTGPGALSQEQMLQRLVSAPQYRAPDDCAARQHASAAKTLWGGDLAPLMASADTRGRFGGAALTCPPTACTGSLELDAGAQSYAWRNPDAIENIVCLNEKVEVRFGPELAHKLTLGKYDMVSLPAGVRHQIFNTSASSVRLVMVLSIVPGASYDAVFDESLQGNVSSAAAALGIRFDSSQGLAIDAEAVLSRVTRFDTLVPYKKDLNRTSGLPPEATESLSAGNVYPLIVPEGHVGRSRTAPMYGNQGLYISIAECRAGDDGPPPHAHSDTQESFFVLDGSFDMCTGFDNESVVQAKQNDLVAMPNKIMRTFKNTTGVPARLLVIIQGPDRMNDTVSFSRRIGEDFERRFGPSVIDEYAKIKMTFDAEERLLV